MKRKILVLIAVIFMASTVYGQNDSLSVVIRNLHQNLNSLEKVINDVGNKKDESPSSGLSVSDIRQINENVKMAKDRSYGITSTDLGNGDYTKKHDGSFAGMGFNTSEVFISPIAFNHFNGNISYVSSGYEWGFKTRKWNDRNWWLTKTHITNIAVGFDLFNTNEYQASIKASYSLKFAHNLIEVGSNVESGVYSSFKDSIMEPYFSGGIHGSVFCLYGAIGLTYSKYIPYESLYNSTKSFIPSYQIGVKSPSIKIDRNLLLDFSAMYCNYAIYQPKVYIYDASGNVVENTSGIVDTDVYKGSVSIFDNYGNVFQIGTTTWDLKHFQVGFSVKVNLRNIYRK